MRINNRFVITGGPGAGKTTTLLLLEKMGCEIIPESARAIIKARKQAGLSPRPDGEQFGHEMLQRDIAAYDQVSVDIRPVFFDRAIGDCVAFLNADEWINTEQADEYQKRYPYNPLVFIFSPWQEIYSQDEERDQSFAEAITVCDALRSWYEGWDYHVLEVPQVSPENRATFILNQAKQVMKPA